MKRLSAPSSERERCEITCTILLEHCFCPRFTYFEQVLAIPERQEKRFKVLKGREVHEKVQSVNRSYLRKKIGCVQRKRNVHLATPDGLVGVLDEILTLEDGAMAPLDYKFAVYPGFVYQTYRMQVAFYAELIVECLQKNVDRGFIVFTRSKNKLVQVPITRTEREQLHASIARIRNIVRTGALPAGSAGTKACRDCCYRNICDKGRE